ncbi:lipoyl(octanoyl) transferase LipB [Phocaeicola paurosaccharolyticus]|jgi:lipoyl(octanoyl) transferase|uniref:lipoyl(octanoyl) transferase LipB n=1 Tax=Phocaeicola paurosaccharolyticus TaxID=732242 RepID=UPI000468A8E5|nr:lipoyl(octanoyl) transferase LipB [Phocaeicola paurosaccharolyticus]
MKREDWGIVPYEIAWKRQEELFNSLVRSKLEKSSYTNHIVFVEHPHVYTIGKSGKESNMLMSNSFIESIGASIYHIDRGGDITYHGPGQIVCYPIINIEEFDLKLRDYIYQIEQAVIETCAHYGIEATRVDGATGVWLDKGKSSERKICAIGVRCSHFVTMHGLAFNINTDLNYFSYINPCGFVDKGVTSLQKELGHEVDIKEVTNILYERLITNITKKRL